MLYFLLHFFLFLLQFLKIFVCFFCCIFNCPISQSIQKVKDQPLQPAAWASISAAVDDRVCQSLLGVQLLALPRILPGEVPWPDRDVGRPQPFAQLQGGNNRASPAPGAAYRTLCAFLRGFTVPSELCRNLELLWAVEVLLLTCPSAFCHYWHEEPQRTTLFPAADVRCY